MDSVWERRGTDLMSKNLFALMLAFWILVGLAATGVTSYFTEGWQLSFWVYIGVLVIGIIGVVISHWSDNPIISLIGYMLVAIPFGVILGPLLAEYTTASVVRVAFITGGLVAILGIVGAIIPDSLEGWRSWLFGGLVVLLLGYLMAPFTSLIGIPVDLTLSWLDWAGIVIFSICVIFDMNRAMRVPYTMDNAIDCALALYLDIINIFIRLLSRTGDKK